jgi:uncharacterized protein
MDHDSKEPSSRTPAGETPDRGRVVVSVPYDMTQAEGLAASNTSPGSSCSQALEVGGDGLPMAIPVDTPLADLPAPPPRPWGFWATLGWSAAVMVLLMLVQVIVVVTAIVLAAARKPGVDLKSLNLETNGLLLSVATTFSAPLCIGLIVLLIRIRRYPIREYLGLEFPSVRTALKWLAVTVVFVSLQDLTSWLTGRSVVSPFMIEAYKTAGSVPLLFFVLIVAAPLFEELQFRGFMFHGIASSRAGAVTAVLLTSLAWAGLHLQYGLWGIGWIFVNGILFGIARVRTRSVILTILLHAVLNIGATIELLVYSRMTA